MRVGLFLVSLWLVGCAAAPPPTATAPVSDELLAVLEYGGSAAAQFDALLLEDAPAPVDPVEQCVQDAKTYAPKALLDIQDELQIGGFARSGLDVKNLIRTSEVRQLCTEYFLLTSLPASTQWVIEHWDLDNVTECSRREYLFRHC